MNAWEKVNCWSAVGIVASLLVFGGYSLPKPAAAEPPAAVAEQVVEPALPGGMTEEALLDDAWVSYEALQVRASAEASGLLPEHVASYEGQVPKLPADHFTVASQAAPNVTHVFRYVPFTRA